MSQRALEQKLKVALNKLEESSEKIVKTRGYTEENEKIKMLVELIKEQLTNADTRNSVG